jgi:pimeloyl-ACP methyl ester carboxylesterase
MMNFGMFPPREGPGGAEVSTKHSPSSLISRRASRRIRIDNRGMALLGLIAALLLAGLGYQRIGLRRQRREFVPPGEFLLVGGHHLHTICSGQGMPLVLLESGIAATSLSWSLVMPEVATFTRVCAYDRAGLGWSDPPSPPWTFDRVVDDLAAVLERIAPGERYVLVGHSFGSFVVRAYATRHPDRVIGLVLVDPALQWLTATAEHARLLRGGRQLSRVGAVLAHLGVVRACLALLTGGAPGAPRRFVRIFGPTAAGTLARLVGEVRKLPPNLHPIVQALWCQPKCFHAMADHLSILEREAMLISGTAAPREIPVTVISSADQPAEQLDAHARLAQASLHGRHLTARRGAHWVQFDDPALVVDAIRAMVS